MWIAMKLERNVFFWLLFGVLFFGSSCIPVKEMVLVKSSDEDGEVMDATIGVSNYLYKIKNGDELAIRLKDPEPTRILSPIGGGALNSNGTTGSPAIYKVDDNGNIKLPEIGWLEVGGLTLAEITSLITESVKGYILDANIHVSLENYYIKVLGQVKIPGLYKARTSEPNFFEALGLANGLTDYADRKDVQIIRNINSEVQVSYVDISNPEFFNSPYYYIYPGDVIVVNPIGAKKFENNMAITYALSALSTLAVVFNLFIRR